MKKKGLYIYRCIKKISSGISRIDASLKVFLEAYKETVLARKRLKDFGDGYKGSYIEYNEVVVAYWKKYGVKPKRFWYSLYCYGKDKYEPRFIPESLWVSTIRPYFNDMTMRRAYVDKGIINRLFEDVKKPETIVKKIAGYYYNGDGEELIDYAEAIRICEQEEHLIIKPSIDSYGGSGIEFYDRDNNVDLHAVFKRLKEGFVVQRIVKQHPDLEKLNPDSLNTLRVISFHFKGVVYILSAQLRVGGIGSRVDNITSGGSACSIKPDGWLHEKSVTRKTVWSYETATGYKYKDIRVPNYEGIKNTVKRLHCRLPYFDLVGWDFAVGEDGSPILIEFNLNPRQNQIGGGEPTFGDLSDEVFEEVFIKKTHKIKRQIIVREK